MGVTIQTYHTTNTSNCSVFYCNTNWFYHSYETYHRGNLIQNFLQLPRVFLGKKRKSPVVSRTGHLNHNYDIQYDMIYLLTAIGLTPAGSSTVHIYTQTIHRTTQLSTRTTQLTTEQHN